MPIKIKKQKGFTLIELLVSVTVGAIAVVLVIGIFAQTLKIQRRAFFMQRVQENIGLMLEVMAKEVRVSTISTANSSCPASPANLLTINHPVNGNIEYSLSQSDGNIHRRVVDSGIDTVLNSSSVTVNALDFCVNGNTINDDLQPKVTILLSVQNKNAGETFPVEIQTTVSQRQISD